VIDERPQTGPGEGPADRHAGAASALIPVRDPAVSMFPLDDELVLHDSRDGEVFVLNPTAARVWMLCDGSSTAVSLAQSLAATFGLGQEEALGDVLDLLADLRRAELLVGG
jgi:hypothetical protein